MNKKNKIKTDLELYFGSTFVVPYDQKEKVEQLLNDNDINFTGDESLTYAMLEREVMYRIVEIYPEKYDCVSERRLKSYIEHIALTTYNTDNIFDEICDYIDELLDSTDINDEDYDDYKHSNSIKHKLRIRKSKK